MKSFYLSLLLLIAACCASAQTTLPNLGLVQLPYQYPHYEIPTNANWAIVDELFSNGPCGVDGIHALTYSNSGPKKFGCTTALLLLNPVADQTITSSANQGLILDSTRGSIHIWPNDPTFGVPIIRLNSKVTGDAAITWALNGVESFALYHHGGGNQIAISETDVGGNDIFAILAGSVFLGSSAVPSTFVSIGAPLGLRFSGGQDIGDVGLTASPANGYFSGQIVSANKKFVVTDFTDANSAALQAITGLSYNLGTTAATWSFHCSLMYSQATNVAGDQFGIGVITTAPTNVSATGRAWTNTGAAAPVSAGVLTGLASTTPTAIVTFQPAVTTVLGAELDGTVETAGGGTSTLNMYVLNGTAADVIVVKRGSYCAIY